MTSDDYPAPPAYTESGSSDEVGVKRTSSDLSTPASSNTKDIDMDGDLESVAGPTLVHEAVEAIKQKRGPSAIKGRDVLVVVSSTDLARNLLLKSEILQQRIPSFVKKHGMSFASGCQPQEEEGRIKYLLVLNTNGQSGLDMPTLEMNGLNTLVSSTEVVGNQQQTVEAVKETKVKAEPLSDDAVPKDTSALQPKGKQKATVDCVKLLEKTPYKGGLLGDEMGMGKTIQAVSLVMSDYPQKDPTLVVVPPVALMQWSTEIKEYTDGKLNVLVYHGQNSKIKGMSVKELKKYDVIMISYNSLESLHRKETKGWSRGEDLVKEDSPIHAIHFHRLILDEAHSIKSRTTGVAKACFALNGTYKWCLSGTPVQNRIGEFFSLLRFLEVRPFADYFCKRCPCSILHWKLDEDHMCVNCKHGGMEHVSVFNQELLNPLTQSEDPEVRHEAMDKLHMITARIMLRRMKRDHTSSMELPPKEVIVHNEFFGEIERDFSQSIMTNTSRTFDTYVARGVMLNNYANIFGLIMQMRQVANHPDLLLKKHAHEGQNVLVCNICDEPAEEAVRSQ
ncbi:hypothetical protein KC351_g16903, partial [Hortaea werneckii]